MDDDLLLPAGFTPLTPEADDDGHVPGLRRARRGDTGQPVVLARLPAGSTEARRRCAALAELTTPCVLPVREVLGGPGDAVLVLDDAPGGSLAALLARRGRLGPGEVVTVVAPLADAVGQLHDRGEVHGALHPGQVVFSAQGMPLLLGALGPDPAYADPAGAHGPASDVLALGRLCAALLTGSTTAGPSGLEGCPGALAAVVAAALAPDPARRPSAAALAGALQRAWRTEPVQLHGGHVPPGAGRPAAAPVASPPGSRRLPRLRLHVDPWSVGGGLLVALLLGAGLVWAAGGRSAAERSAAVLGPAARVPATSPSAGRSASATPGGLTPALPQDPAAVSPDAPAPSPDDSTAAAGATPGAAVDRPPTPPAGATSGGAAPPGPDWRAVLDGLDATRARAFAGADARLLSAVYLPGSAALAADTTTLAALAAQHRTALGVRHALQSVEVRSTAADRADLEVVDVLGEQRVLGGTGRVVEVRPGRSAARYAVTLLRSDPAAPNGWRIASLAPEATGPTGSPAGPSRGPGGRG